jgi:adenosylcobinamide-GDP ribazoletransferase
MPGQTSLFLTAVQFLTRLPVPKLRGFESHWLPASARYFPLVGVLVGVINVGVWWLARERLPDTVAVGLMLAASVLVTGAFHEDGFADTCDGLGGGTSREQVLAIMRDSRIGAYGAIGIALLLGLKWTTLVAIPTRVLPFAVVSGHMASRWCAAGLIWGLRYVRPEPDGTAKPLADQLTLSDWILSGVIGSVALLPIALAMAAGWSSGTTVAFAGAACAALATAGVAALYFRRRIGGYTGDCLGAAQQLAEIAFLLTVLAMTAPARTLS